MDLALRIASLVLPLLLGAVAGRARLFADPDRAIQHLNLFALHFAFPALVFVGIADARFSLPDQVGFYATVPLALGAALVVVRALGREHAGTLALVVSFGNVAYLGLPLVARLLGDHAVGLASLAVAIHVALSMSVGPALLTRWSRGTAVEAGWRALLRQPLLLAPFVGLGARALPPEASSVLVELLRPLGAAAAPVAIFLLGLYLHRHRRALVLDGVALGHVAAKTLLLPLLTFAWALLFHAVGVLAVLEAQVLVLLAGMPAAITTFAIAQRFGVGEARVSQAIVASTLASALTLAALMLALRAAF